MTAPDPPGRAGASTPLPAAAGRPLRVLVFGDSLSEGIGDVAVGTVADDRHAPRPG